MNFHWKIFVFLTIFVSINPTHSPAIQWVKLVLNNKTGNKLDVGKFTLYKSLLLKSTHKEGDILKESEALECSFLNLVWRNPEYKTNFSIKFHSKDAEIEFQEFLDVRPVRLNWRNCTWSNLYKYYQYYKKYTKKGVACCTNLSKCKDLKFIGLTSFEKLPEFLGIHRTIIHKSLYSQEQYDLAIKRPHKSNVRSDQELIE